MSLQQSSSLHYRAPQGRPRAIPPCDVSAPPDTTAAPADGRPVYRPGENRLAYASRVSHWLEAQDPERKARRVAKMTATLRKKHLKRMRSEAANRVIEGGNERWYTPIELADLTGWSPRHIRTMTAHWPCRPSQREERKSPRETQVFGNPATLKQRAAVSKPADIEPPIEAPRLSLWQRIKRWFA